VCKVPASPADLPYVPSQVSNPGALARAAREILGTLVRNFDRDSKSHGKQIRELAHKDRHAFYASAIEILASQDDSRGVQFLVSILVENELLLTALSDLVLTREQATALARAATRAGQMVDVAVARHLAGNALSITHEDCPPEMQRLMDLLAEISDGTRILPSLMALTRLSNPYLHSKAVLMIGRMNRNVKWVKNRLAESDSRVRGNAVEALWGLDTEEARSLWHAAARDGNNRVAGNALIALYRLGDCWSIQELNAMANHQSRRFRATAAWVMGKTGDPRFTRALARMVGEPNIAVRTRAFAALGLIKAATARARQAGEWRVLAHLRQTRRGGWRELQVEVCSSDGREQIKVLPTQVILTEKGEGVTGYVVEERPAPGALAVAFLFPRASDPAGAPFNQGALRALAWKRPSDLWSAVPYISAAAPEIRMTLLQEKISFAAEISEPRQDIPLHFTCDPQQAAEAFVKIPARMGCSTFWGAMRRSVQFDTGPARGQRHVIVYGQWETGRPAGYPQLASAAMNSHTAVHAISLTANSALENLCHTTKGTFQIAASEGDVAGQVEQACLRLLARYAIRYQPAAAGATSLGIRVQSAAGWGETNIPIPPQG